MKNPQAFLPFNPGEDWDGMTLLDYFAGQTLKYFCDYGFTKHGESLLGYNEIAQICYDLAKAMLREREKINMIKE